jgi:hypothetical protein
VTSGTANHALTLGGATIANVPRNLRALNQGVITIALEALNLCAPRLANRRLLLLTLNSLLGDGCGVSLTAVGTARHRLPRVGGLAPW